jgi:hypothetical protein
MTCTETHLSLVELNYPKCRHLIKKVTHAVLCQQNIRINFFSQIDVSYESPLRRV